jgi:hypothetical protein
VTARGLPMGVAALAVTLVAPLVRAQDELEPLDAKRRSFHSPQHFAAELRLSPFTPAIDSDPALNGATPYQDVFGSSPHLLLGFEFDWQVLRIPRFGSIGPGLAAGYTHMSANAQFASAHNGSTTSGEQTSLSIYPFDVMAVLRADVLWREARIPLVPYAKVGIGYALWRASNTLGTSQYQGISGEGHSVGTHLALGLGLNLNPFDPYAAQNFDDAMGVNGTYLFAEWTREDLTGLGQQQPALRVGGTSWTFGLAFEF